MKVLLENAGKKFGSQWIFRGLNLTIDSGQQLAVTGFNGSGKSTLLGCIGGYLLLNEGNLKYHSKNSLIEAAEAMQRISWMGPGIDFPDELKVFELLDLHFSLKGSIVEKAELENWVKLAGLAEHKNKFLKQLSSGMRQRVKLLTAILSRTELLLLDEPTTNLDEAGIDFYLNLVSVMRNNRTLIVASNLSREYEFCDETLEIGKKKTG